MLLDHGHRFGRRQFGLDLVVRVGRLDSVDVSIVAQGVFVLGLVEERVSLFAPAALRSFGRSVDRLLRNRSLAAPSTVRSLLRRVQQIQQFLLLVILRGWLRFLHDFRACLLRSLLTFLASPRKIGVSRWIDKLFGIEKLRTLLLTVEHFLIAFICFSLFVLLLDQVVVGLIFLLRAYLALFNAQIIGDLLHLFSLTLLFC